jgi:hypothetical protein
MSFGKFGAHPRSMSNGLYWVSRHLDSNRHLAAKNHAVEKFNDRWFRLQNIHDDVMNQFIIPLQEFEISQKDFDQLSKANDLARDLRASINANINTCSVSELSKYATQIKKIALIAMEACRANDVYNNITDVSYSKESRGITVSGQIFYFLG